jgi:hypothetical protein
MHTDQGLEEEAVGELSRLRAQLANRERLLECLSNLWFVLLMDSDEYERRIAGLECALRGLHDRAIQAVTVCERAYRCEREESEPELQCYQP